MDLPRRLLRRATLAILALGLVAGSARADSVMVDLQLVLAVDISNSMDPEEQRVQRQGYAEALNAPEVLAAIARGAEGRIAIAYVEWAGSADQQLLIDWQLIDGPASARAFTETLLARPYRRVQRTSISGGLAFAAPLFETGPYRGIRQVIDISGDGANNQGAPVTEARDKVLDQGIVINGLPILINPSLGFMDVPDLDLYYADCVIGGPGAFVIPIRHMDDFLPATRRKLLQEIAGLAPEPRIIPAAMPAAVDCNIGERMWRERNGLRN